jgi:zinc protease
VIRAVIRAGLVTLAFAVTGGEPARAGFDIVPVTSPGGIEAWLREEHAIPILTINASFLGGPSLEPESRQGSTSLMAALLDEGAGELDSAAFATAIEDLAAQIAFSTSDDGVQVSAIMLSEDRGAVSDLLRLALTEPRFDPEPVERLRAQTLASIQAGEADPQSRANLEFYEQAFPGHPYGRLLLGTAESVAAMTVEDLRAARAGALAREHLRVAVVGDITPAELGPLLDRAFGALPEAGPELPAVATPQLSGQTTVLDFDTPQSFVVFGDAGLAIDDPDIIPAVVMDYVLGGGSLGNRLNEEMRVKRGLTYGAFTWLASGQFGSLYMGTFSSSNERVAEAIALLRAEWIRMAEHGVSEAELASAKRYLTGEFPLRFDGSARTAAQLLGLQLAGHDIGYVDRRNDLVEAVTAEDVARVARRLLRSEELTAVVAGRPVGVGEPQSVDP